MASRYATGIVALGLLVVATASCNALLDIQEYPPGPSAEAGPDATAATTVDAARDQSSSDALAAADDGGQDDGTSGGDAGDGGVDAALLEGGAGDASEAGGCAASQLACDAGCVSNNIRNCGACGHDCTALPQVGAGTTCAVSGQCVAACLPGWAHCSSNPDDGCEVDISNAMHCGNCTTACGAGTPFCTVASIAQGGGYTCSSGCTAASPTLCGTACADTSSDSQNCGGCGNKCSGGKTCQGGGCACPGGTHDCSGTCSSNSSTASCGTTSCVACPVPTNGGATCNGSACGIGCNSGFSPCGSTCVDETQNGNCGGCGVTCGVRCTSSACVSAKAIAVGFDYACAVLSDGTVQCWGGNESGQLGYTCPTGDSSCQLVGPQKFPIATLPHVVPGVSSAVSISAPGTADHTCVVLASGQVMCWGANGSGQLGYSSSDTCATGACSKTAQIVPFAPGVQTAVAVATSRLFTCALLTNHTVQCWGDNSLGNLGNGTLTASTTPVQVSNLTNAIAISAGSASACALRSNGTVACWGDNSYDELGVETAITPSVVSCDSSGDVCSSTPVTVSNITQGTAIAGEGGPFTCALIGGNVQCWGDNSYGLGDQAGTTEAYLPVSVWGVGSATSIVGGWGTACALISGGTAACWGSGPLGDGTQNNSTTRVAVMGLSNATALAEGGGGVCAILSTGGVSCFSDNGSGQLGNGTTVPSYTLTPVVW